MWLRYCIRPHEKRAWLHQHGGATPPRRRRDLNPFPAISRHSDRCLGSIGIANGGIMKPARVILADDHLLLLDALKNLLQSEFEVVGTFTDGYSLVEGAPELNPDVVVLDIGMPM